MRQRKWTATSLLIFICMSLSCAKTQSVQPQNSVSAEKRAKVLIAARQSEFKSNIIDKLKEDYGDRAQLIIAEFDVIDDLRTDDYDALVVMGERKGWLMFSVKERRFLRHFDDKGKLIMVMTAAVGSWKWEREDVDVITGASKQENLAPMVREISRRLDAVLLKRAP